MAIESIIFYKLVGFKVINEKKTCFNTNLKDSAKNGILAKIPPPPTRRSRLFPNYVGNRGNNEFIIQHK